MTNLVTTFLHCPDKIISFTFGVYLPSMVYDCLIIEALHVTYHPVNMADYSNAFNKSMIAIYRDSSSHTHNPALRSNRLMTTFD